MLNSIKLPCSSFDVCSFFLLSSSSCFLTDNLHLKKLLYLNLMKLRFYVLRIKNELSWQKSNKNTIGTKKKNFKWKKIKIGTTQTKKFFIEKFIQQIHLAKADFFTNFIN